MSMRDGPSASRIEVGIQIRSEVVRKTIQSIKEIVGNHSDIDIYQALKETNMDPNETVQKLLNQDPFHEVKRRRDKKKENMVHDGSIDPWRNSEHGGQGMKLNTSDWNSRRGYVRNALPGFVRENRVNQNMTREAKPAYLLLATSGTEKVVSSVSGKGSVGSSLSQRPSSSGNASEALNVPINPQHRAAQDGNLPPVGRQKASQPSKEWKSKSSQKPILNGPCVIGTSKESVSPPTLDAKDVEPEAAKMQDKLAQLNIQENQNVIIAQHIRVHETDRSKVTFGSFGAEFGSTRSLLNGFQSEVTKESNREPAASSSVSSPESSIDDASGSKPLYLLADQNRNSGFDSPPSREASEHQSPDKKESSSFQNLENYVDMELIQDNSPSYVPSDSQQRDPLGLPGVSAYDPHTGYDIPYFRPIMDDAVWGQGLPSPRQGVERIIPGRFTANSLVKALSSHNTKRNPQSTICMVNQRQKPPVAHMYISNPRYPHPFNGNNYMLMPGSGPHVNANNPEYGVRQFEPVPAGSPTGFGNFTNPNGYTNNAPRVMGSATGLEDLSRIKYNDGNIYVPNPQVETSEVWIQNGREFSGSQSNPYYNRPGQWPHAAYLPSHPGHASFNAAKAQSSHMHFPRLYHPRPRQLAAFSNPHHRPGPAGW